MDTERNKATIRSIYAALQQGDRSVFSAFVHQGYIWHFPGHSSWSRTFTGRESILRDLLEPLFAQFTSLYTARLVRLMAEDDIVVAEVRGDVETKSGIRYDNEYCFIFEFRDGKIAKITEYCDTDLEERALGNYEAALAACRAA